MQVQYNTPHTQNELAAIIWGDIDTCINSQQCIFCSKEGPLGQISLGSFLIWPETICTVFTTILFLWTYSVLIATHCSTTHTVSLFCPKDKQNPPCSEWGNEVAPNNPQWVYTTKQPTFFYMVYIYFKMVFIFQGFQTSQQNQRNGKTLETLKTNFTAYWCTCIYTSSCRGVLRYSGWFLW